jgi:hypothetical protein
VLRATFRLCFQVVAAWQRVARRLTDYEDHEHEATYDKSLTLKTFCLSAIPACTYLSIAPFRPRADRDPVGNLTLTAYVYSAVFIHCFYR